MPRVAVLVLNWNGADFLQECINSLLSQDYGNFSVIVVDNGSIDESPSLIRGLEKKFQNIICVYNKNNLGFAGGVNVGIKHALSRGYEMVALFNNDAVAEKEWLSNLVRAMDNHSDTGIVTGLLLDSSGKTIDSTGDFYTCWGLAFPRGRDADSSKAPDSGYVFGASGGASLYKLSMLREIGFFDENFFAYYEDVDLSFRAQLLGYRVYYTKDAVAYHQRGATSSRMSGFTRYQTMKNLPLLFWKNVPNGLLWSIGPRFALTYLGMLAKSLFRGDFIPAIRGTIKSVQLIFSFSFKERRAILAKRRVKDEYIKSILWSGLYPESLSR